MATADSEQKFPLRFATCMINSMKRDEVGSQISEISTYLRVKERRNYQSYNFRSEKCKFLDIIKSQASSFDFFPHC